MGADVCVHYCVCLFFLPILASRPDYCLAAFRYQRILFFLTIRAILSRALVHMILVTAFLIIYAVDFFTLGYGCTCVTDALDSVV